MLGRLITVESFQNAMEARLYQQQLEAAGIRCVLADETAVSMFWHLAGAIGGIKLQVAEEDFERANAVLDELEQRHRDTSAEPAAGDVVFADEAPEEVAEPDEKVEAKPGDDEEEELPLNAREDNVERAYRAVLVGFMFIPLQLYATWILLDVWQSDLPIRPSVRRKLYWAIGLHLPMVIVALVVVLVGSRHILYGTPQQLDLQYK